MKIDKVKVGYLETNCYIVSIENECLIIDPGDEIDKIMSGDVREAHIIFAKELIKMYDDINEFESVKERYMNIAKGNIPNNIEQIQISENEINICDLLVRIGLASSKSEAKRMISGNGVKINGKSITDIGKTIIIDDEIVVQFGKNKFKKVTN